MAAWRPKRPRAPFPTAHTAQANRRQPDRGGVGSRRAVCDGRLQTLDGSPASPFYRRLNLDQIGLWGHSFGGATAAAICEQDARCKAGVDMDGTPVSSTQKSPLPRPFMFITEDYSQGCDINCDLMRQV